MKGRKPKPIELRVLHGDAAEKAKAEQPKPRRVLPRCPDYLSGVAAQKWRSLSSDLYDAGLLTAIDRDALAQYCVAFARWREAEEKLAKSAAVVETKFGNIIQNPWLSIANKAFELMLKLEAEFGMTPSSRTRVKAAVVPEQQRPERERPQAATPAPRDDPRRLLV